MSSMVRTLGAPVTDAKGKSAAMIRETGASVFAPTVDVI